MTIQLEKPIFYSTYELANPTLLTAPTDLPKGYIAYNPSAIWTVEDQTGKRHDIMYVREEPDRSNATGSHLGKSYVRPYIVDLSDFSQPLRPYRDAEEKMGEDPALTRINRRLSNGAIEAAWLLSCVDAQPFPDRPDQVKSLVTRFHAGTSLNRLEHIADGPAWMKDIRVAQDPTGRLQVYGRPQPEAFSGNITHTTVSDLSALNADVLSKAPYIDENLWPTGSGIWGGVNDVFNAGDKVILATHRARRTGKYGNGRRYEAMLYEHDPRSDAIVELGVLATANQFPAGATKADEAVDLHDVVFPGGGYNGTLQLMTFGVRDASIGISRVRKQAQIN